MFMSPGMSSGEERRLLFQTTAGNQAYLSLSQQIVNKIHICRLVLFG